MCDLQSGCYFIASSSNHYNFVGRPTADSRRTKSTRQGPKDAVDKILSMPLPPNTDIEPPKWAVEKLPNGRYSLKSLGAPTGIKRGLLWADQSACESDESSESGSDADTYEQSELQPEEWQLRPFKSGAQGKTVYTIEWASGGAGWVRQSNEPYTQIAIAPLSGIGREEELWTVVQMPVVN